MFFWGQVISLLSLVEEESLENNAAAVPGAPEFLEKKGHWAQ